MFKPPGSTPLLPSHLSKPLVSFFFACPGCRSSEGAGPFPPQGAKPQRPAEPLPVAEAKEVVSQYVVEFGQDAFSTRLLPECPDGPGAVRQADRRGAPCWTRGDGEIPDRSGGADTITWDKVSVTAYLSQNVIGARGGVRAVGERNARELRNLAEILDALRAGNVARIGDIAMGRFSAIEVAMAQGGWSRARHLEAVAGHEMTSAGDRMMEMAATAERRRQRLEQGAAKARGQG